MPSSEGTPLGDWSTADLRFWCVGGWRFQIRGGRVHPLDGGGAEQALARHLAIRHPDPVWGSELETTLSRDPQRPIPRASLHVAANKLRRLLRNAAGNDEGAAELAKELLPRAAGVGPGPAAPDDPAYSLNEERVWIDVLDAPDAFALAPPCLEGNEKTLLAGGDATLEFAGFEQLQEEVGERVKAARATPPINVAKHLEEFTPPISNLADLIPVALDRLSPGSRLTIEGPGDSGRLHLAEAVELAAHAWCGRSTLQIREWTDSESQAPLPGHVYVLDLTRELTKHQGEALRVIHERSRSVDESERPALLLVSEEGAALPPELQIKLWTEAEPIELSRAGPEEAMEAYLIATRNAPREVAERRADFDRLAAEYEGEHDVAIGLRAASAAAAIGMKSDGRPPDSSSLPAPSAEDLPLRKLGKEQRTLAKALAWFSNSMFTLEDAQVAVGEETLSLDRVLALATQIPGGGSEAFELRPKLIAANPLPETPVRICDHLLEHEESAGETAERWPERAVSILESEQVELSKRLKLVPLLIQPCRERGSVENLAQAAGRLLIGFQSSVTMDPVAMEAMIGRARLLADLGKMGDAQLLLWHVTRQRESKHRRALKMDAHLRLAIVTSQLGETRKADKHAAEALQLSGGELQGRVTRFFGWEAMFSADFEAALARFQSPAALDGSEEERADALLGATQALLRLGRLKDAEANLPKLERMTVGRTVRDRISRTKARTSFLRGEVKTGIEIINSALPRGGSGTTFESAPLLEARSYLRTLDGEVIEAIRDLERCEALVKHARSWKIALLRYIRALISEKQALRETADEGLVRIHRDNAREKANESLDQAGANPWHRARARTLLARLALEEGDHNALAWNLRFACTAHSDLEAVCPDVLSETVQVALAAADLWQMPGTRELLDSLGACLVPRDVPLRIDLRSSLRLIEDVAAEVVDHEPPDDGATDREPNLWILGRVGHAIVRGCEGALAGGGGPTFRVIHPRQAIGLDRGAYELDPTKGRLVPLAGPKPPAPVRGAANRRFALQRLAAILVIGTASGGAPGPSAPDPYLLPQWADALRTNAQEAGVAVIERFPLELEGVEALGLDPSLGFLSLGLAELPVL